MTVPLFYDEQEIAAFSNGLPTRAFGKRLFYFPQTESTNDLAMCAARGGEASGTVFVADSQSGGRGRRGRKWESPPNLGLLFSIIFRPGIPAEDYGWIPLVTGLACAEAVERETKKSDVTIKWPNDIVIPQNSAPGWRKLGGILCESSLPGANAAGFVVIGIGLNVNHRAEHLPELTRAPAASLALECGSEIDRKRLLAAILRSLEEKLELLHSQSSCGVKDAVIERQKCWWSSARALQVESAGEIWSGSFAGLDNFGRLQLKKSDASVISLADAEIISVTSA